MSKMFSEEPCKKQKANKIQKWGKDILFDKILSILYLCSEDIGYLDKSYMPFEKVPKLTIK